MIKTLCLDAINALYNFINPIVEQPPTEVPYLMTIELSHPLAKDSLVITGTPCYENKSALEILETLEVKPVPDNQPCETPSPIFQLHCLNQAMER
ncbi:hypothetical protein SAMN05216588_1013 [Pseudomonas flavescens]|uniref:Uncharacterized protein n=1 Tax=Phytopseudomonas flavescens TaxID=29435 RepID=A0A1G7X781_9GAMM|nr:hypothetical protein [Pseudomonas flavescens]SDG80032.1 hypothetical protein SAMN05216588_1013 [Pseudomonas flavescens]